MRRIIITCRFVFHLVCVLSKARRSVGSGSEIEGPLPGTQILVAPTPGIERRILKRAPRDCHAIMVRTDRWKYVWWQDFRPMLFDLVNDPKELRDLGADSAHAHIRREMEERMAAWLKARKTRVTVDDAYVEARTATHKKHGIFFGVW